MKRHELHKLCLATTISKLDWVRLSLSAYWLMTDNHAKLLVKNTILVLWEPSAADNARNTLVSDQSSVAVSVGICCVHSACVPSHVPAYWNNKSVGVGIDVGLARNKSHILPVCSLFPPEMVDTAICLAWRKTLMIYLPGRREAESPGGHRARAVPRTAKRRRTMWNRHRSQIRSELTVNLAGGTFSLWRGKYAEILQNCCGHCLVTVLTDCIH